MLRETIANRLPRPVGRPSLIKAKRFFEDFRYQTASWSTELRVIPKTKRYPSERFPQKGFIVNNLCIDPDGVVQYYHQRSTAEQHIKEDKHAFHWTRLSCRQIRDNGGRLQLHVLTYNIATFLRCFCALSNCSGKWTNGR